MALALADKTWWDAPPEASPLPREVYYPSVQVFLAREQAGSPAGLAVAAKGGHNGENHNHNDIGTVIVALDGTPVVIDAGRSTYTAQTFGPDRYGIWSMRSGWHNVPVVTDAEQGTGPEFRADAATAAFTPHCATFTVDLAGAYPPGTLARWRREVTLERRLESPPALSSHDAREATSGAPVAEGGGGIVRVSDQWELGGDVPADAPVELRYLLTGRIVNAQAGVAEIETLSGRRLTVTWPRGLPYRLVERPLDDPAQRRVWGGIVTQLRLDARGEQECAIACYRSQPRQTRTITHDPPPHVCRLDELAPAHRPLPTTHDSSPLGRATPEG
jgi:hypothetical protein